MPVNYISHRLSIGTFIRKIKGRKSKSTIKLKQKVTSVRYLIVGLLLIIMSHCLQIGNKQMQIKNGNIGLNSFNLIHWNKERAHFNTSKHIIEGVLEEYKPDIFSMCEANIITNKGNYSNIVHNYLI